MTNEEISKEVELQKRIIEELIGDNLRIRAKVAAIEEALVVREILSEEEIETFETMIFDEAVLSLAEID